MSGDGEIRLRQVASGEADLILAAAELFDAPPTAEWTERFLDLPTHHVVLAEDAAGRAVGFATGVEMTHPDKGTEMFLYELAVAEDMRRRGVGARLVARLAECARSRGRYGMWVITEADNAAALRTYAAAGGAPEPGNTVFVWDWRAELSATRPTAVEP